MSITNEAKQAIQLFVRIGFGCARLGFSLAEEGVKTAAQISLKALDDVEQFLMEKAPDSSATSAANKNGSQSSAPFGSIGLDNSPNENQPPTN